MTEVEYFTALNALLDSRLCQVPEAVGNHYVLHEAEQKSFELSTRGLPSHKAIQLEKLRGVDWPCFKSPHNYAHKRCDSIIVTWDKVKRVPQFLLIELKSSRTGTARKQLGASLAFCHFLHRMACVNQATPPVARFAAITVLTLPFSLKTLSLPTVPHWDVQSLQPDCKHMQYDRSRGSLPVAAVASKF